MKNSRIWELLKEVVKDEIEENNINENELKEGLLNSARTLIALAVR